MAMPTITTAIPKRRYQLSDFTLIVLGDIESSDPVRYRYLMGVIPQGAEKPQLFISAEQEPGGNQRMSIYAEQNNQSLRGGGPWNSVDSFCDDAINVAAKLLGVDLEVDEPFLLS